MPKKKGNLNQPVTLNTLFEFTDDHLLPGIEKIMDERFKKVDERFKKVDERFDKLEGTLSNQYPDKAYLDNKLADLAAELGGRIQRSYTRTLREFKPVIVEIIRVFERHKLVSSIEIKRLKQLLPC